MVVFHRPSAHVQPPMYPTLAAGVPRPPLPYAILVTGHKAEQLPKHSAWFAPGILQTVASQISVFQLSSFSAFQMTSAKVRSILRKYHTPPTSKIDITAILRSNPGRKSGEAPPETDQRNPSITPTIGLSE